MNGSNGFALISPFQPAIIFIVIFGGVFSFILALGQLVIEKRDKHNYLFAFFLFCLALFLASNGISFLYPFESMRPILFNINITFFYLLGPMQYFYFKITTIPSLRMPDNWLHHFIPAMSVLFFLLIYGLVFQDAMTSPGEHGAGLFSHRPLYAAVIFASMIHFCAYLGIQFTTFLRLYTGSEARNKKILRLTLSHNIVIIAIVILWSLVYIFNEEYIRYLQAIISLYVVSIFLLSIRYPQYLNSIKMEVQLDRYCRSQVKKLDVDAIIQHLTLLMEGEKIFCYEDLGLEQLASELDITQHQLSEILNDRLGNNFFNYINMYRINEAKELLMQEPDRSIISIAHAVGYNSLSAFYNSFQKFTGTSPAEFRKGR
jgi:AraC-like DNA-binding protein